MSNLNPFVSVIIPSYNNAAYLGQAIQSVLNQTYPHYEIVVVDDGSTDNTSETIQKFIDRIHYIRQDNLGPSGARNTGISNSSGALLAFLDSDDVLLPRMLEVLVKALDEQPELGVAAGGYEYVNEVLAPLSIERPWRAMPIVTLGAILVSGLTTVNAVLVRRSSIDSVGGFDVNIRAAEDSDLWYRLCMAGCTIGWVRETVCKYRIHGGNTSRKIDWHFEYALRALDKLFERADCPVDIMAKRSQIVALTYLGKAGRLLSADDPVAAQQCCEEAIAIDPTLKTRSLLFWLDLLVAWHDSVWRPPSVQFGLTALSVLPETIARFIHPKTLAAHIAKRKFYESAWTGSPGRVWRSWLKVVSLEPGWFGNRGGWSILARSMLSKNTSQMQT